MDGKFSSMLSIILVPQIMELIITKEGINEDEALETFYRSMTYDLLAKEDSKLWHLSPLAIYTIWKEEQETGELILPEGQ